MNPGQQTYLRQCYRDYKDTVGTCERCGPDRKPVLKRWVDAVLDVGDYVNRITPEGGPKFTTAPKPLSDIAWWDGRQTWKGGVFEADSYDSGVPGWYWRLPDEESSRGHHTGTPVDALIECINAYEESIGVGPGAASLVFTVRLPACSDDASHDWKFLYEGRHGSDKGWSHYECRHCGVKKRE